MIVSLLKDNTNCLRVDVKSMSDLAALACNSSHHGWAPGVFKGNYRNLPNFEQMEVIALDFDKGMDLTEASLMFSGYLHFIATSRSHQKEKPKGKSGQVEPACDRFRVVLALTTPITNDADYKATFAELRKKFPAADSMCSDASRFFFPCLDVVQGDNEGFTVDVVKAPPAPVKPKRELTEGERGKLARSTLEFITIGSAPGGRHAALFKAAKDLQEQGFDEGDAEELLLRSPVVDEPGMPAADFGKAVRCAYAREPKYPPRTNSPASVVNQPTDKPHSSGAPDEAPSLSPLPNTQSLRSLDLLDEALAHIANPEAVRGTSTGWKEIDALLGGLRQAELGIVQAFPKSGKTVFLTNLMANLTKQGEKVGFASLEMHPAKQVEPDLYSILLKKDVRAGVSEEDRAAIVAFLEAGRGLTYFKRERRPNAEEICEWAKKLYAEGTRFFFCDHFHKIVPDESSVSSVARTMTALTGLKYECPEMFFCLIVQPTKEQRSRDGLSERVGRNSLRGGAVIFDECDWLINLHTKYASHREVETGWGWRRENLVAAYPSDIREIEFEAIRAKPFSENMGKKLYMKYNKLTTEMVPHKWIAPPIERIEMPEQDEERSGRHRGGNRPQSGWAENTWRNKRV
jgi:DnaB-like helicase C terminal domain